MKILTALLLSFCLLTCLIKPAHATPHNHNVGVVILEGEINGESVLKAIQDMAEVRQAGEDVVLRINSPGGEMQAGFALSRTIEEWPTPVTCVVDGEAASMAMYIFQSCPVRVMTKRSVLMIHQPSISGGMAGHSEDWKAIADYLEASTWAMAQHLAYHMNCRPSYIMWRIKGGKMWWMKYNDAVIWGAVDRIVDTVQQVTGKPQIS